MASNSFSRQLTGSLLLIAVLTITMVCSCKKAIQKEEQNIILAAMTDGQWYVEQYKKDTLDLTANFLGYDFQFYKNGNVDGIKNSTTQTGSWTADIASYSITAAFPATSNDTLQLLNHTWKITDSYSNYVEATTATTTGNNILHLRKK